MHSQFDKEVAQSKVSYAQSTWTFYVSSINKAEVYSKDLGNPNICKLDLELDTSHKLVVRDFYLGRIEEIFFTDIYQYQV